MQNIEFAGHTDVEEMIEIEELLDIGFGSQLVVYNDLSILRRSYLYQCRLWQNRFDLKQ